MRAIQERARQQRFDAFLAYESLEETWGRVRQLVECGRPMIFIRRWIVGGDVLVAPGLHIHHGGFQPGAYFRKDDEAAFFQITLMPGIHSLGAQARICDGSEADTARRFHQDKKNAVRIRVRGFGHGADDHIEITDYDDRGVGWQRSIYFQYESSQDRARRESAFLDGLAAHGDWSSDQLTGLVEKTRREGEPALDIAAAARPTGIQP